jgi:hypothetical protein
VLIENLESKETVSGKLTLKEPERVWVDVGSKSARGVGLGLGIGGAVATLIGFAGFVASFGCATDVSATPAGAADSSASGTSGDCSNVAAHVAWGTFMTGAFVTTVVGFAIRSGATSSIAVVPLAAPAPVATRMWAPKGLGLRFAF